MTGGRRPRSASGGHWPAPETGLDAGRPDRAPCPRSVLCCGSGSGAEAFRPALEVVAPVPLLAGLVLGGVAVLAQAARWRVLMAAHGIPIGRPEALAECYRASALNAVLPGGVAGDVLRAWRQRARRAAGLAPGGGQRSRRPDGRLCLLLAAAAVVLVVQSALPARRGVRRRRFAHRLGRRSTAAAPARPARARRGLGHGRRLRWHPCSP